MATKTVQDSSLTAIADAIRAKTGKSASMEFPTEFVSEIASISGGGGVPIETGTFTVATKEKTYDIVHSLGVAPNFAFLYPIDVDDESTTYLIMSEVLVANAGQADWRAGTDATQRLSAHGYWRGVGYATNVHSFGTADGLPASNTVAGVTTVYAGEFTNTYARVGGFNQTTGTGWLLGEYGYVVGVMPFVTAN